MNEYFLIKISYYSCKEKFMSGNKLQYKKMPLEELVVLSQQNDFKALEE